MKSVVVFARALADATRWRIIQLVLERALCVCELADILGMPQSSVSSHVQIIRKAGLLESERCGKWTYFRIEPRSRDLLQAIAAHAGGKPDKALTTDTKRAVARLKTRATSCCPAPQRLAGDACCAQ